MRLIILIFFSILPGCLHYFIPPQKLVPNNFRLFSLGGIVVPSKFVNFLFIHKENNSINDKVQRSPRRLAKVHFR